MIIINFLDDLIIIDPFLEHSQDVYIYVCLCLENGIHAGESFVTKRRQCVMEQTNFGVSMEGNVKR